MSEQSIRLLITAIRAMARGELDVSLPELGDSELREVGEALTELGRSLDSQRAEQRALLEVTGKICSGLLLDEVLNHVYDAFKTLIPYDRIGCALIDPSGERVASIWARSEARDVGIPAGYSAPLAASSLRQVLETGRPRILNDLEAYQREHPASESTARIVAEGIRSSLTCPLIADDEPVGFLFFSSRVPGTYSQAHAEVYCQLANQVSLIVEKSRLYEDLRQAEEQLQVLSRRLINTQEEERARYANELHEDLGQLATAATLQLELALEYQGDRREGKIRQAIESVDRMLRKSRQLALRLRPAILDDHGLGHAVHTFLAEFEASTGIGVEAHVRLEREPSTEQSENVYRVLQEALNNAAKYSGVRALFVELTTSADRLTLVVRDEGAGFSPQALTHATIGVLEMRKRVELLGGRFDLVSAPGSGTRIRAELPLSQAAERELT